MSLKVQPFNADFVAQIRAGGPDAYGNPAELAVSNGNGNPCRSCLNMIPAGQDMLIVAARPFDEKQPYAETGPIFFCKDHCTPFEGAHMPPCVDDGEDRLLKGYTADNRILYGTGTIVPVDNIAQTCEDILANDQVSFVDVRSSRNNCFTFRVTRGDNAEL